MIWHPFQMATTAVSGARTGPVEFEKYTISRYVKNMSTRRKISDSAPLTLAAAMKLQQIEGNALDAEQIAMFEMFEREWWDHSRRIAYIRERYTLVSVPDAAG